MFGREVRGWSGLRAPCMTAVVRPAGHGLGTGGGSATEPAEVHVPGGLEGQRGMMRTWLPQSLAMSSLSEVNSGATWRIVGFVRQHAATSRARSSSGRLHGRPLRAASAIRAAEPPPVTKNAGGSRFCLPPEPPPSPTCPVAAPVPYLSKIALPCNGCPASIPSSHGQRH